MIKRIARQQKQQEDNIASAQLRHEDPIETWTMVSCGLRDHVPKEHDLL